MSVEQEALGIMVKGRIAAGEERKKEAWEKVERRSSSTEDSAKNKNPVKAHGITPCGTGVTSSSRWEPEFGIEKTCISAQMKVYKVGEQKEERAC